MASPFPERRSPSRRFLPPDPRTSEPYRFTPQLALRLGVLAALALAVFADPLPPPLGAAGALRRPLPERRPEQPAAHRPGRGSARLDRRSRRQDDRLERPRHRRAVLGGRPAGGGPLRDVQEALDDPARAAAEADEGAREEQGRPADADPRQDGRARGPGDVPERAPPRVPRRRDRRPPTCATTRTARSPPRCSGTSARSRRRS